MMDVDAQQAAMTLAQLEVMHLFEDQSADQPLDEYPVKPYHQVYHSLRSRYAKISASLPGLLAKTAAASGIVSHEDLKKSDDELKTIWSEVSALDEELRRLKEQMHNQRQLAASLDKFSRLDLDLGRLHRQSDFLNIIVGTVLSKNYKHLQQALSMVSFVINSFYASQGVTYAVIVGPSQHQQDLRGLLQSADFREITIPEEFSGSPGQMQHDLINKIDSIRQSISNLNQQKKELLTTSLPVLKKANALLVAAHPYASLDMVLKGSGGLVSLQGWVPVIQQQQLKKALEQDLSFPFYMEFMDPSSEEYDSVPSLMKHHRLLRPFQNLVSGFGIPAYREMDPTSLFMFSYILMFGMMFGDVGHGLVIAVAAVFIRKAYPSVSIVALMAGLSSALFGLIYGSLFGYEHVIEPLWMSPMSDPQRVLLMAVVWGVAFLLIAQSLSIRNELAMGHFTEALRSSRGLAGLLLYVAIIYTGYRLMQSGSVNWLEGLFLLIPLMVVLHDQWSKSAGALSERILVVAIEGLEQIISSVSATLSFLRVAAFSLNHIALAAAVFSIAGMMDSTGHWITVVLGNIFIIVLEGAIVAIQCLRLEYYEGFSRFFSGKGKAFEPLKLESY